MKKKKVGDAGQAVSVAKPETKKRKVKKIGAQKGALTTEAKRKKKEIPEPEKVGQIV